MIRSSAFFLIPVLFAAVSHAGEVTIEPRPFTIEKSFTATALPESGCVLLQVEPKIWADFQITTLAAHGVKVAKGDLLAGFEVEEIDKKLTDARRSLAAGTLSLAQAELDLKKLVETSPYKLEAYRRVARIAKEENAYFTQTSRKSAEESAGQQLKRRKEMLENEQEELKQLTQMYKADDVTEDTEEIILTRQKDAVAAAEFALRMEKLAHTRTVEVLLPREAVTLVNNERDTAIAMTKAELDIPRAIELKKIELEGLKTANAREKDALAELEKDRKLFEIKAPADGWFYHGSIENGRWSPPNPELLKSLVIHGRPTVNRPFATFVPASAKLVLAAFVDEATARSLKPELSGIATLAGREDLEIPVILNQLAISPGLDGSYRVGLTATWPKDLTPVTGSTVQARLVVYQQDAVITVPTKAIGHGPKGWTVDVKLTNGKTEKRPIKRGRVSGDQTEILSGLEIGQVIVSP